MTLCNSQGDKKNKTKTSSFPLCYSAAALIVMKYFSASLEGRKQTAVMPSLKTVPPPKSSDNF